MRAMLRCSWRGAYMEVVQREPAWRCELQLSNACQVLTCPDGLEGRQADTLALPILSSAGLGLSARPSRWAARPGPVSASTPIVPFFGSQPECRDRPVSMVGRGTSSG
jgi:hypothetical protein